MKTQKVSNWILWKVLNFAVLDETPRGMGKVEVFFMPSNLSFYRIRGEVLRFLESVLVGHRSLQEIRNYILLIRRI